MSKFEGLRAKINKDDGHYYRIGNRDLNAFEVAGYLLIVASMVMYLLHQKLGLGSAWLGWLFLSSGSLLVVFGVCRDYGSDKNRSQ